MRGRTYAFHGRRTLAVGAYPWMLVGMTVIRVLAAACLRVSTFVSTCLARDNRTGSPLARSARETRPIFSASPMAGSFPSSASRRSTCAGVIVSGTSRAATTAGGAPPTGAGAGAGAGAGGGGRLCECACWSQMRTMTPSASSGEPMPHITEATIGCRRWNLRPHKGIP